VSKGFHDQRYRKLIEKLVDARRTVGLTQTELADRLGKRQQFVSKYEGGERRLDIVELVDIAVALGLDPANLVAEIPPAG
jgi:transcriptional regulator with XRE-family HTH domain